MKNKTEEREISTGIYKITNLGTGKVYIGESFDIESRWTQHKNDLLNNLHINKLIQNDFNVYGKRYFKFEILQEYSTEKPLVTQAHLILLEDAWIKLYKERNIELYNIENSLEEIFSGNKLLQIAPRMATNILIGQIQKYCFHFNHQTKEFELEGVDTIKSYLQNSKGISGRKGKLIETEIKEYIKKNKLENKFYNIIFSLNTLLGYLEVKEISNYCKEYIESNY